MVLPLILKSFFMIYNSEEIGERFHKAFSGPNLSGPSLSEIYSNIQGIVRNFLGILCSDIPEMRF